MADASGNSVITRIVSSNTWVNGESANWKLDYYKYKGFTFAEVLKRKIKYSPVSQPSWVRIKMSLLGSLVVLTLNSAKVSW